MNGQLLVKIFILNILLFVSTNVFSVTIERDFRAVWVATAWNGIDFPSTKITNGEAEQIKSQKSEIIEMLDSLYKGNINAIMFQVRGHADAMYKSSFEPWSKALTGTRGVDPKYDPFEFIIAEAHKRGIEVHAWVNPYRVSNFTLNAEDIQKSWVINAGTDAAFLDPGNKEVQDFTMKVIMEIIQNYDIDGLVFDDYFYKSMPTNSYAKNENHRKATNNPYDLSIDDWRRENVNQLMKQVHNYIEQNKPHVRFGISPFGIYSLAPRKAYNSDYTLYDIIEPANGITGADSYATMYCDAATWLKRGYIDYISPQLYWPALPETPTYKRQQDYTTLCKWWIELATKYNRHLFSSNDIANNGTNRRFNTPRDILAQLEINDLNEKVYGSIFYSTSFFINKNNKNNYFAKNDGYHNLLIKTQFKNKALTPAMIWKGEDNLKAPTNVRLEDNILKWEHDDVNMRFAVYSFPMNIDNEEGSSKNQYLHKICYNNELNLNNYPNNTTQQWAVRAYSRIANLSDASFVGTEDKTNTQQQKSTTFKTPPVFKTKRGIRIDVNKKTYVQIFNSKGKLQYQNNINKRTNIKLKRGKYIIKLNNKSYNIEL